jgi:LysM domain
MLPISSNVRTPKTALTALLLAVFLAGSPLAASSVAAQSANLLVNPGFEGLYARQCCETSSNFAAWTPLERINVSYGWTAFWIEPDASHPNKCDGCTPWSRPEYVASTFVRNGTNSQSWFLAYSVNEAGVYQRVAVTPGQRLQFSTYLYGYTNPGNNIDMRVGIDPTGGTNPYSSNVVWSPGYAALNSWLLFAVEATAQAPAVTVFIYARPNWAYPSSAIYTDDASLIALNGGGSSPSSSAYVVAQNGSGLVLSPVSAVQAPILPPFGIGSGGTTASVGSGGTYTVVAGDNLFRISRKFNTTVAAIKTANKLVSDVIHPGQVLVIP